VWERVAAELRDADTERGRHPTPAGPHRRGETTAVLADKGYDADANRAAIRAVGAEPCIRPRRNRTGAITYDRHLYRERNGVERFFGRVKQWRRVATRYDKKARNFLGFVWLAAIDIMLA
jgi:putative transposase